MSLLCSARRALAAPTLLLTLVHGQQCFYPDGTLSADTPCISTGDSSCCGASSFCLDNGLCFGGGIVSRGSCTDKTWQSASCASYCTTKLAGSSIALTPCAETDGASTFVCGLNATACKKDANTFPMSGGSSFILREPQVAAVVAPVLASISAHASNVPINTATCGSGALYTGGAMAGLGVALAAPLLIASCVAISLWRKERARTPKLMYQLPDDEPKISPSIRPAPHSIPASPGNEYACSFRTVTPEIVQQPDHLRSFQDRYHAMNKALGLQLQVQELDGQPVGSVFNSPDGQQIQLQERPPSAARPQPQHR